MARSGFTLAAAAALVVCGLATADNLVPACTWDSGKGAHYDLSPYNLASGWYQVNDMRAQRYFQNYTYYFNVCGDVNQIPLTHTAPYLGCNVTRGGPVNGKFEERSGLAPAFQVFNNDNLCQRLGKSAIEPDVAWGLFDEENPSRGVYMEYQNGDLCPNDLGPRSLKLYFECSVTGNEPHFGKDEMVEEVSSCNYEIYTKSHYGCPTECPIADGKLCGGHGVCDFDSDIKSARCFCDPAYTGSNCVSAVADDSGLGAVGGVLIFVCILLALLLGVLVFLWTRIRGLRLDPKAYSALRGGDMGEEEA